MAVPSEAIWNIAINAFSPASFNGKTFESRAQAKTGRPDRV
jgi:hypothetical protein